MLFALLLTVLGMTESSARPADATPLFVDMGILEVCQRVPSLADITMHPFHVFGVAHKQQVFRIHAGRNAANVMSVKPFGGLHTVQLQRQSVGKYVSSIPEGYAVASTAFASKPEPAATLNFLHFVPKQGIERLSPVLSPTAYGAESLSAISGPEVLLAISTVPNNHGAIITHKRHGAKWVSGLPCPTGVSCGQESGAEVCSTFTQSPMKGGDK